MTGSHSTNLVRNCGWGASRPFNPMAWTSKKEITFVFAFSFSQHNPPFHSALVSNYLLFSVFSLLVYLLGSPPLVVKPAPSSTSLRSPSSSSPAFSVCFHLCHLYFTGLLDNLAKEVEFPALDCSATTFHWTNRTVYDIIDPSKLGQTNVKAALTEVGQASPRLDSTHDAKLPWFKASPLSVYWP